MAETKPNPEAPKPPAPPAENKPATAEPKIAKGAGVTGFETSVSTGVPSQRVPRKK